MKKLVFFTLILSLFVLPLSAMDFGKKGMYTVHVGGSTLMNYYSAFSTINLAADVDVTLEKLPNVSFEVYKNVCVKPFIGWSFPVSIYLPKENRPFSVNFSGIKYQRFYGLYFGANVEYEQPQTLESNFKYFKYYAGLQFPYQWNFGVKFKKDSVEQNYGVSSSNYFRYGLSLFGKAGFAY